jgi:FkbM family methyltransferase
MRRTGVDIVRYPYSSSPAKRWCTMFCHHGVDLVLDVGANDGGFARDIRSFGYTGRIVSFEPLSDPFTRLSQRNARDERWSGVKVALGPEEGNAVMNVAANSYSSSLLPMRDEHRRSAPHALYVGTERVRVERLDDLFDKVSGRAARPFLKIDVQGYESQVLDGAARTLDRLCGVQLEMSLIALYDGQHLFDDLFHRMLDQGFDCWSIDPEFSDPGSGRYLQVMGTFFRR